jgi:hypothetical protein
LIDELRECSVADNAVEFPVDAWGIRNHGGKQEAEELTPMRPDLRFWTKPSLGPDATGAGQLRARALSVDHA